MSLLLCRQRAKLPFLHNKLNIRIWSEQELCYVIYNYPLLCRKDFIDEKLYDWIESELKLKKLADSLRQNQRVGETVENQMLFILQNCNYYDVSEIRKFGSQIVDIRRNPDYELVYMEGILLYRAEKLSMAYDSFARSVHMIDEKLRRSREEEEQAALCARKADIFCDMAVILLRMSDENKALELLISSELTYYNKRAARMRYLVNGAGELGDEEKAELDELKAKASEAARAGEAYNKISELFEKDSIKILNDARTILSRWKNNYRKM